MSRTNHTKPMDKSTIYSIYNHGRSSSIKSTTQSSPKKPKHEKALTQTTASKHKQTTPNRSNHSHSPGKVRSKPKMEVNILSDKISSRSMRRGRLDKEKTFMIQSLNMPLDSLLP